MEVIIALMAHDRRMRMVLERRLIRDITNPFNVPEIEFRSNYRLPQFLARDLIREIEPFASHIPQGIPLHIQVLCALSFYGGGSYQRRIGRDAHNFVSQSIVSRSIRMISKIISTKLGRKYIKFPQTIHEITMVKQRFLELYGVPGIIGLIDCSHIPLTAVKRDIEMAYVNRNGFHSLNVQFITDATNLIRNVNARFPGSLHDSLIWRNSRVYIQLQSRYTSGVYNEYLLGDSGYPLQPWLMVPIDKPVDIIDQYFNRTLKKIRSGVERTIAILKGVCRCLLERKLRYDPIVVTDIVNACAVIHNILVVNNAAFGVEKGNLGEIVPVADALQNEYYNVGHAIRRRLAERIF